MQSGHGVALAKRGNLTRSYRVLAQKKVSSYLIKHQGQTHSILPKPFPKELHFISMQNWSFHMRTPPPTARELRAHAKAPCQLSSYSRGCFLKVCQCILGHYLYNALHIPTCDPCCTTVPSFLLFHSSNDQQDDVTLASQQIPACCKPLCCFPLLGAQHLRDCCLHGTGQWGCHISAATAYWHSLSILAGDIAEKYQ